MGLLIADCRLLIEWPTGARLPFHRLTIINQKSAISN
jgi:hypothetical protein